MYTAPAKFDINLTFWLLISLFFLGSGLSADPVDVTAVSEDSSLFAQKIITDNFPGHLIDPILSRAFTPYTSASNPAFLFDSPDPDWLWLSSKIDGETGGFRPFTVAEGMRIYSMSARGKKKLNRHEIFGGEFKFFKKTAINRHWLVTGELPFGMPFVSGDSATGDQTSNGIALNATYARYAGQRWQWGIRMDYEVDETLKAVSPKPVSNHVRMRVLAGWGWKLNPELTFNGVFGIGQYDEEILYSDDRTSSIVPTLIKFRGYDYPITQVKTDEKRRQDQTDYYTCISLFKRECFIADIKLETHQLAIRNNGTQPRPEGKYQLLSLNSGISWYSTIHETLQSLLIFKLQMEYADSRHPDYDLTITNCQRYTPLIRWNLYRQFSGGRKVGIIPSLQWQKTDYTDDFSEITWNLQSYRTEIKIEFLPIHLSRFLSQLSYSFRLHHVPDPAPAFAFYSPWANVWQQDIEYYYTSYYNHRIELAALWDYPAIGNIQLSLYFNISLPKTETLFEHKNRWGTGLQLDFLLPAY